MRQAVSETVKLAEKVAGGSPYALVGASLGGRVAIEAAARHPEHLAAMHGSPNLLLQMPGADHGIALLDGTSAGTVQTRVQGFLTQQLPTSG